jgi:uncharacterized protein (TIGR02452 family)
MEDVSPVQKQITPIFTLQEGTEITRHLDALRINSDYMDTLEAKFRQYSSIKSRKKGDLEIQQALLTLGEEGVPTYRQTQIPHTEVPHYRPYLAAVAYQSIHKMKKDPQLVGHLQEMLKGTKVYDRGVSLPSPRELTKKYEKTDISIAAGKDTISTILEHSGKGDKVAALVFASRHNPLGGYLDGADAQEERCARATNIFPVMAILANTGVYPFPETGGIYIPGVSIMRTNHNQWLVPAVTSNFIFSAAYRCDKDINKSDRPESPEKYAQGTLEKIQTQLEIAIENHIDVLILGGWGCGVYNNDSAFIAQIYAKALKPYDGYFKKVVFTVYGKQIEPFTKALSM